MSRRGSVFIIVGLVIFVLLVILLAWLFIFKKSPVSVSQQITEPIVQATSTSPSSSPITYLPSGTQPAVFPSSLPIEGSVQVLQDFQTNYPPQNNAASSSVAQQSVYEYVTTLSVDQAYSDYSKYFSSNGWKVAATINQTNLKSVTVQKGSLSITATFSLNSILQKNSVSLTAQYDTIYLPPGNLPAGTKIESSSTTQ